MKTGRLMKVTALAACTSMLFALPVFADNGQSAKYNMSQMQFPNNMQSQNSVQGFPQMQGSLQQNGNGNGNLSSAAQFMVNQGIIKGDTSGDYSMSSSVKRCDMSVMLARAFNLSAASSSSSNFNDVEQGSYYYEAVNAMRQLDIAQGDGQNFNPNRTMTLEEAILFVQRALDAAEIDYSDVDLEELFADRSLSEAATREDVSAILYAVLGDDYTNFVPAKTSVDAVTYETDEGAAVNFKEDDFTDACSDATDETLDYIVFSSLSSTLGKLYYDYESASNYNSIVSTSEKYYADEDDGDAIDELTFVPKTYASGTVTLGYTGYDIDGNSFKGTVVITIKADDTVADTVALSTEEDTAITFDENDFNDACEDTTGETLSYVKFTLPSTSCGKLYYGYEDEDDYTDKVSASSKYYYDSDDDDLNALSNVTFVPKDGYTGTVKIAYTGWNTDGVSFTGTVKITVD